MQPEADRISFYLHSEDFYRNWATHIKDDDSPDGNKLPSSLRPISSSSHLPFHPWGSQWVQVEQELYFCRHWTFVLYFLCKDMDHL